MSRSNSWKPWGVVVALGAILLLGGGWVALQTRVQGQENHPAPPGRQDPQDAEAISHANSLSHAFRQAAAAARPSVVKILGAHQRQAHEKRFRPKVRFITAKIRSRERRSKRCFPKCPAKGNSISIYRSDQPERDGLGSGVIIDKSGIVLTNNHVVRGADEVTVVLKDGREFKATDIKTDPASDLAVLRLEGRQAICPPRRWAIPIEMEVGDWVLAIGCPFGLEQTVSAGIISGKGRELEGNRDRVLANRCRHQSGQLGRPAGESRRRSDRHQHGHRHQ